MSNIQLIDDKPTGFVSSMKTMLGTAICSIVALSAINSAAATSTATMAVTATVAKSCTIAATALAFGPYTLAVLNGTATITMTCTNGTNYVISANSGTNATNFNPRVMKSGSNTLNYNIYTTNGYTTIWGDGTNSTSTVPGTGNGTPQSISVYGQIPANQTAPATGTNYSDTITFSFTTS